MMVRNTYSSLGTKGYFSLLIGLPFIDFQNICLENLALCERLYNDQK